MSNPNNGTNNNNDNDFDEHTNEVLRTSSLSIVVVGASGDLAKKKTYPSLFALFKDKLLPSNTKLWGYARSKSTDADFRNKIRPYLEESAKKAGGTPAQITSFLDSCFYQSGPSYGDIPSYRALSKSIQEYEASLTKNQKNRLFYFAIPPNVFGETGVAIKQTCMTSGKNNWTRLIVEKPFGRDLESFEELNATLSKHFHEEHLYRIDHYLGKEMVQNLHVLRFANTWFERCWNADNIQCVLLTFKEPFGTEGRGGYFDQYGIIRDILQNHLLQVLTLMCMEAPSVLEGPRAGKAIRDAKVAVLNAIVPIELEDCVLGQYEGYADDPTITNKQTNCPTYCLMKVKIRTPRWQGVPIFLRAGKAMNEKKAEMRIQFKDAPASEYLFQGLDCPRNELVMRLQPNEAVYMKTNVKSPGFTAQPIQTELEVNYDARFFKGSAKCNPDAYTRLIFDVLRGKQSAFVRDDELRRAWELFTPVLHRIENENIQPQIYKQGSRGPDSADTFLSQYYKRNEQYVYNTNTPESSSIPKSVSTDTVKTANIVSSLKPTKKKPILKNKKDLCDIGLMGLAVMGQNFALNMADHGFRVAVGNRSPAKVTTTVERAKAEGNLPIVGCMSVAELIGSLKKPRRVVILVQAGKPVDDTIAQLSQYMEKDDIIIDGGNEWYPNSVRRAATLKEEGIRFLGMGISGGEEGARYGPALMPGGPRSAYEACAKIFEKCAATTKAYGPCTGYLGPIGSGNYVKMVHNGIEYGDMQLIAEVYDVCKSLLRMSNAEIAATFQSWNTGDELNSYLMEITCTILKKDDDRGRRGQVLDYILDKTGMKGTGRWTVQEAAERSVPIPTITAALDGRFLSGRKEERVEAELALNGPASSNEKVSSSTRARILEDLRQALFASKVCSYAQGMSLIQTASAEFDWNIPLAECARIWMGGCIIRAKLLLPILKAYESNPTLNNLMMDPLYFRNALNKSQNAWRRVVAYAVTHGIAVPAIGASLTYYDSYRRGRLPANLTQAQRDYFGSHTYKRTDNTSDEACHTIWSDTHYDKSNKPSSSSKTTKKYNKPSYSSEFELDDGEMLA